MGLRRRWLAATALAGGLALGQAPAFAAEPAAAAPADTAALRDQVRQLTALVHSLAERDQLQIQALTDQVQALTAQVGRRPTPTAGAQAPVADAGEALPRVLQNATGGARLPHSTQQASAPDVALPRVVQNASHRFAIQSADGQYSIGLTGDVQFDTGAYADFRPASAVVGPRELSNGVNARRARIGIAGTAFGAWGFGLVYDAGNSSDVTPKGIETAQIVYSGIHGAALEIGYSNTFFTLDQSTSSNDTLFLERASPSNIATNFNTGDARSNAGVRLFGDRYWLGGYVTGPASGDSHTLTAERLGAFQRAAFQVLKGPDYTLHLGVGVDELLQSPNTGPGTPHVFSVSDQP